MHYERNYNGPDHNENCANALRDTLDYLDEKQWNVVIDCLLHGQESCNQIAFALNFVAGVSGFPIHALIEVCRPEQYQAWFDALPD